MLYWEINKLLKIFNDQKHDYGKRIHQIRPGTDHWPTTRKSSGPVKDSGPIAVPKRTLGAYQSKTKKKGV